MNVLRPATVRSVVTVNPSKHHQSMIGFGGITTPTAYAELSVEGKRQWWRLVSEYNPLIQREYPNGTRLNPAMVNYCQTSLKKAGRAPQVVGIQNEHTHRPSFRRTACEPCEKPRAQSLCEGFFVSLVA